jgi:hypothetical protein
MSEHRKKPSVAFWATVVAVGPLLPYIASYVALVEPQGHAWPYPMTVRVEKRCCSQAGGTSPRWQQVFAPLNALDRIVRPEKWAANPWK